MSLKRPASCFAKDALFWLCLLLSVLRSRTGSPATTIAEAKVGVVVVVAAVVVVVVVESTTVISAGTIVV